MNAASRFATMSPLGDGLYAVDVWERRKLTPAADAAVVLAEGIKKLADLFVSDIRSGSYVAAERTRKQIVQMSRELGNAWLDAMEEEHGPAPRCKQCSLLEGFDCECPPFLDEDDDIPFA